MRVEVYRNLHTGTWSVRDLTPGSPTRGRVIDHPTTVIIANPEFVVQPAGREKVRREGRKNVHAFVRGTRVEVAPRIRWPAGAWVKYNPYKNDHFVTDRGDPISDFDVAFATLGPDGVWAYWEAR